jgi:Zn-finger nucleic acid-binding protein
VSESNQASLCPDCGRILRRYKIWPDILFYLDRCGGCNGVWLDQAEWQTLGQRNQYHCLHLFFTEPWQRRLREEETRRRFEKIYKDKFGATDYERIKEIRIWLDAHPQGAALLADLLDNEPYRTLKLEYH